MTGTEAGATALIQVRDGRDFQAPRKVLNRIPAAKACSTLSGFGYSLATYVLHASFWQRVWLNRLTGGPRVNFTEDWQVATPEDWPVIRSDFLLRLDEAIDLATSKPFKHCLPDDEQAASMLLQIAVHDAYHVGQFVVIKRVLARQS